MVCVTTARGGVISTAPSPKDDATKAPPEARFIRISLALTHLDDPTPSNCKATTCVCVANAAIT